MITIIAGGRDFTDVDYFETALDLLQKYAWTISTVVSGTARGADKLGENWATDNDINLIKFKPEWTQYGKGAGFRRNEDMANYAEALVAFWDGKSKGTKHMIDTAVKLGLYVKVFHYE